MKKNVILLALLALFVASCSKSPVIQPEDEVIEGQNLLSFSIDGFEQEILPFPSPSKLRSSIGAMQAEDGGSQPFNLRDHVNAIQFKIYKGSILVDSVQQFADGSDFGKYKRYLPASKDTTFREEYQIYIAAAQLEEGQEISMSNERVSLNIAFKPKMADGFYTFKSLTLPEGKHHQAIRLTRFVGKLEINPTDSIPANAGSIKIEIADMGKFFYPYGAKGFYSAPNASDTKGPHIETITIKPEDIGKAGLTFSSFFIPKATMGTPATPRTVTITSYDKDNRQMFQRVIPNVTLDFNKRTRLSGMLFSNQPNADFDIELDGSWDADVPEFEF